MHPNIGAVGCAAHEAQKKVEHITVCCADFRAPKHTLSSNAERTLMELIVEDATDRVVGAHMVGPDAGETV